eukprot:Partr_v1_DN24565_c0_g1_i1_m19587 putative Inhibitor of growth family member
MEDFKAAYLEDWMDTIESLPCELQRNFSLIKELDAMSQDLLRGVESSAQTFVDTGKEVTAEKRKEMLQALSVSFNDAIKHGENKVSLAMQTYDLIDRHIRRLDADLVKFEDELTMTGPATHPVYSGVEYGNSGGAGGGVGKGRKNQSVDKRESPAKRRRPNARDQPRKSSIPPLPAEGVVQSALAASNVVVRQSSSSSSKLLRSSQDTDIGAPGVVGSSGKKVAPSPRPEGRPSRADPNEPTYCICNNVSYGAMIACDNQDCDIEWFHYECVGLNSPPKGKWYCDSC